MSKGLSAKSRVLARGLMVHKAQALSGQDVPDLILSAIRPVPEHRTRSLDDNRELLLSEAKQIVAALRASLPGGTLDRVAALLMMDRSSDLVIREQDIPGKRKT